MPSPKKDLLQHFIRLDAAACTFGAQASLDTRSFWVELRQGALQATLYPQFVVTQGGVKRFTSQFDAQTTLFAGWRPRPTWQWELSKGKLAFKQFALANGIPTPAHTQDPHAIVPDVIVKRDHSSFAANIRGPFRTSERIGLDLAQGEYIERFVPGTICKAWFWEGRLVCMELERMPWLRGDGERPIRELVTERLAQRGATLDPVALAPFLAYHGKSLGSVIAKDETMTVEFRYNSPLLLPSDTQSIELAWKAPTPLTSQISEIGAKLWQDVPSEKRPGMIFTLDAIVDGAGRAWALEVNGNPFLHPAMYEPMVRSLVEESEMRAVA